MLFLIRYGEIGLKSPQVRRRLRDRLVTNIQDSHLKDGIECITSPEEGRIFVWSKNVERSKFILSRTFGVVSFSPVVDCSSEPEDVIRNVLEHFKDLLRSGRSFAVRVRRTGSHSYTSQELASTIGARVQSSFEGLRVDLNTPDLKIFVEIRGKDGYVYSETIPGPGGLPLGSQGKVLGLVDCVRGALSCWLMMKRGCKVHFAFMNGVELVQLLEGWDPKPRSHRVRNEREFYDLAERLGVEGVVFGSDIKETFSQKREDLAVFYPVLGLSSIEIDNLARRIGLENHAHEETQKVADKTNDAHY
ncbi:MAG: THUMP domain-containing protein [Thermoplasmata archaeon]